MEFFKRLFDNVGATIKSVARFSAIIGTVYNIAIALFDIIEYGLGLAITSVISGLLTTWFAAIVLYGFGHLIEKVEEIAENTRYR